MARLDQRCDRELKDISFSGLHGQTQADVDLKFGRRFDTSSGEVVKAEGQGGVERRPGYKR